jgi:putative transcriptional regulator
MIRLLLCATLLLFGTQVGAQEAARRANGVLLVAKPELIDPNFSRTVVLVTQTEGDSTVGVILNRPGSTPLSEFLGEDESTGRYAAPVFSGGPVMRRTLVAVFHSDHSPAAPAFHVLRTVYMSMHPETIRELLTSGERRFRLYAGFSGWAPRQLESEFEREGWFILPADEDSVFRSDTSGLWEELAERAQAMKTRR